MRSPGIRSIGVGTACGLIFIKSAVVLSKTKMQIPITDTDLTNAWRKKKRPVQKAPGAAAFLFTCDDQERDILLLV